MPFVSAHLCVHKIIEFKKTRNQAFGYLLFNGCAGKIFFANGGNISGLITLIPLC
jgi:hypothetical protein